MSWACCRSPVHLFPVYVTYFIGCCRQTAHVNGVHHPLPPEVFWWIKNWRAVEWFSCLGLVLWVLWHCWLGWKEGHQACNDLHHVFPEVLFWINCRKRIGAMGNLLLFSWKMAIKLMCVYSIYIQCSVFAVSRYILWRFWSLSFFASVEYDLWSVRSQIQWFWRALRSFDQADRARFLQFVTGTSKVPLQGFAFLEGMNGIQKFQIHRDDRSTDRLPSAHTWYVHYMLSPFKYESCLPFSGCICPVTWPRFLTEVSSLANFYFCKFYCTGIGKLS